ncbi:MAG: tetratricopeptide repeat protein [Planctomycetota bacterium]
MLVSRGATYLCEGRIGEARRCLEEAIGRAPGWAEPYYFLGRAAAADRSADEQESWCLAALERTPRHRPAEKALLVLRAWRHEPIVRAWHLFYASRFGESLAAFDGAIAEIGSRAPESSRADCMAGIGWCYYGLKDYPHAVDAFRASVALSPQLIHAHKGLGICQ